MGKKASAVAPTNIRSRIVGEGMERPDQLLANPQNWRRHPKEQLAALEGMLDTVGWVQRVIVNRTTGHLVDGHARVELAMRRSEAEERLVLAGLDPIGGLAVTDQAMLDELLAGIETGNEGLDAFLAGLHGDVEVDGLTDPDDAPEVQDEAVSQSGDVWVLGRHRVMCGDSTDAADVARLMGDAKAALLHADPPYGMGKQADGVANDNLYKAKLDAFQMKWWRAFRPHLLSNASAYIWGNAPDLWRLWYRGGLVDSEVFEFRNEITWDKKSIAGMASPDMTQYPEASERCLFFQFGTQFLGNINADDFPEAWGPLLYYMQSQADGAGIDAQHIKRVCGCGMFWHWFSRSQFTLIPEKHYAALRIAYPAYFERQWADLKAEWDRVKDRGRAVINGKLEGMRSYFDNAHDTMRDVWEFPRVTGEDRHGHATPKPVAMMERAIRSACPEGFVVAEPFGGSGSTLMGAERTGRACFTMELQGNYTDVIVRRWQAYTDLAATLEGDGRTFDEIAAERAAATA